MVGIGFELRRAVDLDAPLWVRTRAWASAGLIASGPWLITIAVLTALQLVAPRQELRRDYEIFRALVTYASAFSLIGVGLLQVPATRWLADALWRNEASALLPALLTSFAVTGAAQAAVGVLFVWHLGLAPLAATGAVALYVAYTWSWLALVWLGATRDYDRILVAYALGSAVSLALAAVPELRGSLDGLLWIVALGQGVTVAALVRAIVRAMPTDGAPSAAVLGAVRQQPLLLAFGALYNVGIWADKLVFWSHGEVVEGALRKHSLYDTSSFLAYATVVPALAVNLVRIETAFYPRYRAYYALIEQGGTLDLIRRARERMVATLRDSAVRIVRVQGWVTAAAIVVAPELLPILGVPDGAVPTFRVLCIGAYFPVLSRLTLRTLLYFDRRRDAATTALLFCVMNAVLPSISAAGYPVHYGLGYAAAALGTLLFGLVRLQRVLERLEYHTFHP